MSEDVTLKPCPFCGGEATRTTMRRFKYVSCENSDCSIVVEAGAFFSREEEAIAAWNTRTGEDERIAQAVAAERARILAILDKQERIWKASGDTRALSALPYFREAVGWRP